MADRTMPSRSPLPNRPMNDGIAMSDDANRLDGVAKVTGSAKYGRDVMPKNGVFVSFIRCPWGHAQARSIDEEAASAVAGVLEVEITGREGRYHGEPIGHIAAESLAALRRARSALNIEWDPEDADTEIGSPEASHDDDPDGADHVLEAVYTTPVQTHSSLETHGTSIDHMGDRAIIYASTQGTFSAREGMDRVLGMPQSRFKVVCEFVGGGFGSKLNGAGKEGLTAGRIAAKYGRPAWLFCDRAEEHLDTGNRPSSRTHVRIGYRDDGTIVGGSVRTWGGVGVAGGGGGVVMPSNRYDLGRIRKQHADVRFNGGGPRAFRAPGHPQGAFAEELMIDEVATATGRDPLELRMKLDREDERRSMYELGARLIGWKRRQPTGTQASVLRRGFGIGSTSWNRFPARADAEVVIHPDASVEVRTGSQDIGTGQRTAMAIVVARQLGVPLDVVHVSIGDSSLPAGPASGGSVTATNTSLAMLEAADNLKETFLERIAAQLGVVAGALKIREGDIMQDDRRMMTWQEACAALGSAVSGRGSRSRRSDRQYSGSGHSMGVQFVDLEVDSETGVIHLNRIVAIQSCGRVICRKTAESQIIGGVIQGLSFALFEDKLLDRNTGAMVNPNLEFYRIAGPADMPKIEPVLWEGNQTGIRPLGEPPTIPTAGAIACAVFNAVGSPVRDLPLRPDRVLDAIEGGRS